MNPHALVWLAYSIAIAAVGMWQLGVVDMAVAVPVAVLALVAAIRVLVARALVDA